MGFASNINKNFTIDTRGFNGSVVQTTTFPIGSDTPGTHGWTRDKVFPATATKVKAAKRMRPVLKGQNYLQLRGKY